MASRQRSKEQRWPLGTRIRKHFEGHGDFDGEVKGFNDGLYSIEYSDGDKEQFDEREMKRYVVKTPSFVSQFPAAKSANPSKEKSPEKSAGTNEVNNEDGSADGDEDVNSKDVATNGDKDYEDTDEETSKAAAAAVADDDDNNAGESGDRNEQMLRDIETMHQELEITGYVRGKTGQKRRKIPRDISKIRTKKRKALEKADAAELAMLAKDDEGGSTSEDNARNDGDLVGKRRKKRLRGSMAALEDDVLEGSMIFQPAVAQGKKDDDSDGEDEEEDGADGYGDEDEDGERDDREEAMNKSGGKKPARKVSRAAKKSSPRKKTAASANAAKSTKRRRQMYRLRNFQSFKMAQRHGDALAAHAQGNYRLAIHKLKAVSRDAPSAPQVYASLGMVYEDMLKESKARYLEKKANGDAAATDVLSPEEPDKEAHGGPESQTSNVSPFIPNQFLREQCDLAKKAYGSHHISAILCKKDFSLWVRAGNCAIGIADLHEEISLLPGLSATLFSAHKAERRRWLDEALRDFLMADNLSPPGIDVPAKLAALHMDLGNLSEALTILTDLKNRSWEEFHSSYKAWLLYADLMLRLGHECTQWNQNVQITENYMVRRWLRKHSATFDWQERRSQALALALGAAAGTKSAREFLDWIQKHAVNVNEGSKNGQGISEDRDLTRQKTGGPNLKNIEASSGSAGEEVEQERSLLENKHQREVDEFDKTTSEMELLAGSDPQKNRNAAREALLESQQKAMGALENEYTEKDKSSETFTETSDTRVAETEQIIMPMSASIGVVCSIASDLMKQLIRLELYAGARLVGETVSNYMKERARLADRTLEARRRADEWQAKVVGSPFLLDPYCEDDNKDDEAEEEMTYLSDEEMLVNTSEESSLLVSLRRGAMPPELQILSGLAMLGEGGRNFVASKYLQAIEELEQESVEWLYDGDKEALFSRQPRWFFFHRTMTEELTKTVAYSCLADTLKSTNKDAEWAFHFSPVFFRHLQKLREQGLIDELTKINNNDITANGVIRRSQILKVMLASCRLGLNTLEVQQGISLVLGQKPDLDKDSRLQNALQVLDTLVMAASFLWTVTRQGLLSQPCIEMVRMSAKCVVWISRSIDQNDASLLEAVRKVQHVVSYFVGGNRIPELGGVKKEEERRNLLEAMRFPLRVTWQPLQYRALSDRTFNISAACNVLPFSGWENEKFSSNLLQRRCGNDFFGLRVQGMNVTGCLPSTIEEELKRQWDCFEAIEPELPKIHFEGKLKLVKESDWYKHDIEAKGGMSDVSTIAKFAEEDALALFLAFSSLCLKVASSSEAKESSFRYKQLALSVLLPLCRFCLDETLWIITSPNTGLIQQGPGMAAPAVAVNIDRAELTRETSLIGESSESKTVEKDKDAPTILNDETSDKGNSRDKSEFEEWREKAGETIFEPLIEELQLPQWNVNLETLVLDQNFPVAGESQSAQLQRHRRTRKDVKPLPDKTDSWLCPSSDILKNIVPVKCSELKRLWTSSPSFVDAFDECDMQMAKTYMNSVHSCMQDLRACFTLLAAEKNCLSLCVALLDLASSPCCRDPFICLQQASMYASQALKAGNSDVSLRRNIPSIHECNPRTALAVLGRADCLHAVLFPEEAAFLCSFVARACALHRNPMTTYEWNDQWKVVGVYAHNVSVMIRATVNSMMNQSKLKTFSKMWEPSVIKELESGRKDAIKLLRSCTSNSGPVFERDLDEVEMSGEGRPGDKSGVLDQMWDQGDVSLQSADCNDPGTEAHLLEQINSNEENPLFGPDVVVYGV